MQVTFNLLMTSEEEKRGSPSSSLRTHSNTAIYTSFSIPTFPTEHKQVKFAKDLCKDVLGDLLLVKRLPKGPKADGKSGSGGKRMGCHRIGHGDVEKGHEP